MKTTVEKRLEALELWKLHADQAVISVTMCCANLVQQIQKIEEEMVNLIADIEADGNSNVVHINSIKGFLTKLATFSHALDAKNTALATVLCRELDLDPELMTKEYGRVLSDFDQVEKLINGIENNKPKREAS